MIDSSEFRKIGNAIVDSQEKIKKSLKKISGYGIEKNAIIKKVRENTFTEFDISWRNPDVDFSISHEVEIILKELKEVEKLQWNMKKLIEKSECYK